MIFIDAAKAQNIHFFELFSRNLMSGGFIITDNLKFHGLVDKKEEDIKSKNLKGLVRKIKDYIQFLKNNHDYDTEFYDIGDGISVAQKNSGGGIMNQYFQILSCSQALGTCCTDLWVVDYS